jgi:carboxypeptidase Taq
MTAPSAISPPIRGFQDLLRQATGKPLDPTDFTAHLTARYLAA